MRLISLQKSVVLEKLKCLATFVSSNTNFRRSSYFNVTNMTPSAPLEP